MLWWSAILSFAIAWVTVRVLLSRLGSFALDAPNARSLHTRPVPRSGGIAVLLGASVALAFGAGELWLPLAIALVLAVLSLLDDLRGLPTAARLLGHFAAAGLFAWHLLSPMHPAELALLIVAVAWITNLYNFMDGSDGLAGGMAAIGFGAYAVAGLAAGHEALAAAGMALAAAALAFLLHNFHPARLFLGDVGSIPLGFLAAALGLQGWRDDIWPLWFPVLVFAPFIADATLTLVRRLTRGERVWQAHREHYYQRMVRSGLGHARTAGAWYLVMLGCSLGALYARAEDVFTQISVCVGSSLVLAALAGWVDWAWARSVRAGGA